MQPEKQNTTDLSLSRLKAMMATHGVSRLLVKELAPNDNSKNQPYVAKDEYSAFNILPVGEITTGMSEEGNTIIKAALDFRWLQADANLVRAPHAKLIFYPQYPEMRLSGFLKGSHGAPSDLMNRRTAGRILFLGITSGDAIAAWVSGPDSELAREYREQAPTEQLGVFRVLAVSTTASPRERLLTELRRINRKGWIDSKSLTRDGTIVPCRASQCVGYTLEAELGVGRNGRSEPDFMGWEVKASEVASFDKPPAAKAITLMTPDPTGGFYKQNGPEAFIRKYGYADRNGRPDRMNFGGVFRAGQHHIGTGLTLSLNGYDVNTDRITDVGGSLALIDQAGNAAAEWSFSRLMGIWNRKHAQAVYVPALARQHPERQYQYGNKVRLAEGTDFPRLIRAIANGTVFYDPGIKLEGVSTAKPATKQRSQFRVKSSELEILYAAMTVTPL
ncbi:MAG: MvaI/BcnI family restriction endonuclease [Hyphomicrobiales bacterium]